MSTTQEEPIRAGVYSEITQADRAIQKLMDADFTKEQISVICSDESSQQHFGEFAEKAGIANTQQGGVVGSGLIGGALGVLVSAAGVATTGGLGIMALGPILAGGVTGTLVELFIGRGVESEVARFYDQAVSSGNVLVAVAVNKDEDDQAERLLIAEQILSESGAEPLPLTDG